MFPIDIGRSVSRALALVLNLPCCSYYSALFEKIFLDHYRGDLTSSGPNRSHAAADASTFLHGERLQRGKTQ